MLATLITLVSKLIQLSCYITSPFNHQVLKMGLHSTLQNLIFKRTSTFALATVLTIFFFERSVDLGTEKIFEVINKGKLWKDIKDNYSKQDE